MDQHCPRIIDVVRTPSGRHSAAATWARNYAPVRTERPDEADAVASLIEAVYAPWVAVVGQRPDPMDDVHPGSVTRGERHVVAEPSGTLAGWW